MLWVLGLLTCSVIVLAIVGAFLIVSLRKNTAMLKSIAFEAESDEVTSQRFNGEKAEQWFEKGEILIKVITTLPENTLKMLSASIRFGARALAFICKKSITARRLR